MKNSKDILYSAGGNDECYTPGYAVTPIIKYLNGIEGNYCNINLSGLDELRKKLFEGQNLNVEIQSINSEIALVTVPMCNINGAYQLDGDGTDWIDIPLKNIKILPKKTIVWCPFDKEESEFVKQIKAAGYNVVHSHIDEGKDYYEYEPENWDVMISNPPFTNKRKIFERALSFGKPFALLMTNTWLNDAAPKQLWKDKELQLLMFEKRVHFIKPDGSVDKKTTFSSSYFCYNFLPRQIIMEQF